MKKCEHYWSYEQTIYGGSAETHHVVRQCDRCLVVQIGDVTRWRKPRKNEFDPLPQPAVVTGREGR